MSVPAHPGAFWRRLAADVEEAWAHYQTMAYPPFGCSPLGSPPKKRARFSLIKTGPSWEDQVSD